MSNVSISKDKTGAAQLWRGQGLQRSGGGDARGSRVWSREVTQVSLKSLEQSPLARHLDERRHLLPSSVRALPPHGFHLSSHDANTAILYKYVNRTVEITLDARLLLLVNILHPRR